MPNRRLLIVALLGLVLVVGFALGRTGGDVVGDRLPVPVTHSHTATSDHDAGPCVLRAECGGAWAFGSAALLLVVTFAAPTIGAATTVGRVRSVARTLTSAVMAGRLERPPQFS